MVSYEVKLSGLQVCLCRGELVTCSKAQWREAGPAEGSRTLDIVDQAL